MKDKFTKQALFRKYLADECTEEELALLFDQLQQDNQDDYDVIMQEVWQKMAVKHYMAKTSAEQLFTNIQGKIKEKNNHYTPIYSLKPRNKFRQGIFNWQRMAAVFIGILVLAGAYYRLLPDKMINQTTRFGQISTITLPDKSVVTLNGNSSIQYASHWESNQPRKVWLQGEAFFNVKHTRTNQLFLVHTLNKVNVEVLGTEFNVNTRNSGNKVVLVTGKVRLNLSGNFLSSFINQENSYVEMQPGELVQFGNNPAAYTKKMVNPNYYCSWRNKELLFENTPLREVITLLQDTYGLKVQVSDSTLLEQKVSGSTPNESEDLLLMALSRSLSLKMTKKGDTVRIER